MAKTEEELKKLKERVDRLREELKELTEDELELVTGGRVILSANGVIKHGESGGNGGSNG